MEVVVMKASMRVVAEEREMRVIEKRFLGFFW